MMVSRLFIPEMGLLVQVLPYQLFRKGDKLRRKWLWRLISLVCIQKEHQVTYLHALRGVHRKFLGQ